MSEPNVICRGSAVACPPPSPGGVSGTPNAIAYFAPSGDGLVSLPTLIAAPIDVYGRPQIWDTRQNAGTGAVWRQGAWQADGDPSNITGEGIVIYEPIDAGQGNFARVKGSRFGIRRIIAGAPGLDGYAWRVDLTEQYMKNDSGVTVFQITRATGDGQVAGTWRIGAAPGATLRAGTAADPNGSIVGNAGDLYLRIGGGPGVTVWIKESGNATNTGWVQARTQPAFGEMYISASALTTVPTLPGSVKIAGTYAADAYALKLFTHSAGRLTYAGAGQRRFGVDVSLTCGSTGPDTFQFQIIRTVGGAPGAITKSTQRRYMSGTNDTGSVTLNAIVQLDPTDGIEVWVGKVGAAANMTAQYMNVKVSALD